MLIRTLENMEPDAPLAVALGFFDGVHLGHAAVVAAAEGAGLTRAVCTFALDDAPGAKRGAPLITVPAMRARLLERLGVSLLVELPFSAVADWTPERYVDWLASINTRLVACGFNYRFGRGGAGDADALAALCAARGIACRVVPPVRVDGTDVTSTNVRALLTAGDAEGAARLLGRPYSFAYEVVSGRRLGRTLSFPTINQRLPEGCLRPRFGVYISEAFVDGAWRRAVTNIGVKPTVGSAEALAETYILDCADDLYGATVEVALCRFVRPETKFASLDALKARIAEDVEAARAYRA